MSFPSPIAACEALVTAIRPNKRYVTVHIGELYTGRTLDACTLDVLRVETGRVTPAKQAPSVVLGGGGDCSLLTQEIVVTYMTCWNSNTGKSARPVEDLTAKGTDIAVRYWEILTNIATDQTGARQQFRFVSRDPIEPSGMQATWSMTFETEVCLQRRAAT